MIISWQCQQCGWMNDNNNGPCHRCAGETKFVKGREVISVRRDESQVKAFDLLRAAHRNKPL